MPLDFPQIFWDVFRRRWRARLASYTGGKATRPWTAKIIAAAKEASEDFGIQCGRKLSVDGDKHRRIDVHAHDQNNNLVIAFESELARWGKKDSWREEFIKLCDIPAELRVLSSVFECGTGPTFQNFLMDRIRSLKQYFDAGEPEAFCLIFGPEWIRDDPGQCWVAYSLEADCTLRELSSAVPLFPHRLIDKMEPAEELLER